MCSDMSKQNLDVVGSSFMNLCRESTYTTTFSVKALKTWITSGQGINFRAIGRLHANDIGGSVLWLPTGPSSYYQYTESASGYSWMETMQDFTIIIASASITIKGNSSSYQTIDNWNSSNSTNILVNASSPGISLNMSRNPLLNPLNSIPDTVLNTGKLNFQVKASLSAGMNI